jgi:hypothetical protein
MAKYKAQDRETKEGLSADGHLQEQKIPDRNGRADF